MANDNAAIPDEQFGFRPKHSTADQLIHVTEFISHGMNQNKSTGAIFLDVAKAFDTVWHDGLVYKLHTAGLPLAMVKLINSFLQNRVFHAKIEHSLDGTRNRSRRPTGFGALADPVRNFHCRLPQTRRNKDRVVCRRHCNSHAFVIPRTRNAAAPKRRRKP
ncbi:hypothetical protein MTP99_018875 [Tenebrio molitor]|nr:hypothetical protein MTP99_018875 [Tenebrio molitor]